MLPIPAVHVKSLKLCMEVVDMTVSAWDSGMDSTPDESKTKMEKLMGEKYGILIFLPENLTLKVLSS